MDKWTIVALSVATLLVLGGAYFMLFRTGIASRLAPAPKRNLRTTWKVVQLGGPLPEGLGLADMGVEYGVVVSTDEMLAQTQTLLFCPLISGVDKYGMPLGMLPWHVQVEVKQDPDKRHAEVNYARKYVSTKIVLPISHNEIDLDGLERGYLDDRSRAAVAEKLAIWLPPFGRFAR